MTNPQDYVVRVDASMDDVDLDDHVVTVKGRRLTEAGAEQLARDTLAEARHRNLIPGRKSLTAGATHSPRVQFRVPEAVAAKAQDRARAEVRSLSELAREALLRYLARNPVVHPRLSPSMLLACPAQPCPPRDVTACSAVSGCSSGSGQHASSTFPAAHDRKWSVADGFSAGRAEACPRASASTQPPKHGGRPRGVDVGADGHTGRDERFPA